MNLFRNKDRERKKRIRTARKETDKRMRAEYRNEINQQKEKERQCTSLLNTGWHNYPYTTSYRMHTCRDCGREKNQIYILPKEFWWNYYLCNPNKMEERKR